MGIEGGHINSFVVQRPQAGVPEGDDGTAHPADLILARWLKCCPKDFGTALESTLGSLCEFWFHSDSVHSLYSDWRTRGNRRFRELDRSRTELAQLDQCQISSETGNGAQGRNRTTDTAIFSRMLYQLSYLGGSSEADPEGPTAARFAVYRRSNPDCPEGQEDKRGHRLSGLRRRRGPRPRPNRRAARRPESHRRPSASD